MLDKIIQHNVEVPSDIINQVYKLQKQNPKLHLRTNVKGWQSTQYKNTNDCQWLSAFLEQCITATGLHNVTTKHIWFNINPHGSYHNWHAHPGVDIVGVCYLQTPKNCGDIEFKYNTDTLSITPTQGLILLFPSKLEHRVLPNLSSSDRITLAFNLKSKS